MIGLCGVAGCAQETEGPPPTVPDEGMWQLTGREAEDTCFRTDLGVNAFHLFELYELGDELLLLAEPAPRLRCTGAGDMLTCGSDGVVETADQASLVRTARFEMRMISTTEGEGTFEAGLSCRGDGCYSGIYPFGQRPCAVSMTFDARAGTDTGVPDFSL